MILWRLLEDREGFMEGSCFSDERYKQQHYLFMQFFEPILQKELSDLIEHKDESYCEEKGIETLLFYTQEEVNKFKQKRERGSN